MKNLMSLSAELILLLILSLALCIGYFTLFNTRAKLRKLVMGVKRGEKVILNGETDGLLDVTTLDLNRDQEIQILLKQYEVTKKEITDFDRIYSTFVTIYIALLALLASNYESIGEGNFSVDVVLIISVLGCFLCVLLILTRIRYLHYLHRAKVKKIEINLNMYTGINPQKKVFSWGTSLGIIALVCISTLTVVVMLCIHALNEYHTLETNAKPKTTIIIKK